MTQTASTMDAFRVYEKLGPLAGCPKCRHMIQDARCAACKPVASLYAAWIRGPHPWHVLREDFLANHMSSQ